MWFCESVSEISSVSDTANARRHLPLARAEPISDGGSTSGIVNGKKLLCDSNCRQRREVGTCGRNSSADTKGSEEGGE